jgi:hypothetical protein
MYICEEAQIAQWFQYQDSSMYRMCPASQQSIVNCLSMYVCMYVHVMYVCMYVWCMYVCMYMWCMYMWMIFLHEAQKLEARCAQWFQNQDSNMYRICPVNRCVCNFVCMCMWCMHMWCMYVCMYVYVMYVCEEAQIAQWFQYQDSSMYRIRPVNRWVCMFVCMVYVCMYICLHMW